MLSADLDMAPNPVPSHLWRSPRGDSIPMQEPQREQRMYVTAEGRLVIRDVTEEDAGTYHCTVQNQHGMSVQTVTLQVMANSSPTPSKPTIDVLIECDSTEVSKGVVMEKRGVLSVAAKLKALNSIQLSLGKNPLTVTIKSNNRK